MTNICKIPWSMVNATQTEASTNKKPTWKPPIRASNVLDGAHNAWPMAPEAYGKRPGVPPGPSAFLPNGFSRKHIMKCNQNPAGSCSSCITKMKVSSDHTKVKHLTNGHGKHMTRKASIKVMKDEVNDVVRFTHASNYN